MQNNAYSGCAFVTLGLVDAAAVVRGSGGGSGSDGACVSGAHNPWLEMVLDDGESFEATVVYATKTGYEGAARITKRRS